MSAAARTLPLSDLFAPRTVIDWDDPNADLPLRRGHGALTVQLVCGAVLGLALMPMPVAAGSGTLTINAQLCGEHAVALNIPIRQGPGDKRPDCASGCHAACLRKGEPGDVGETES